MISFHKVTIELVSYFHSSNAVPVHGVVPETGDLR